ncbi:MAG: ACP S-malonyltransferase [Maricaulaceae bacterium]
MKKTALVICPGRGTYNKAEHGYLYRHHANQTDFIQMLDSYRACQDQITISELDQSPQFSSSLHVTGDNASSLIYGCALADFQAIDQNKIDIVGVTGNSMGWYLALAASKAVSLEDGARIVNTTGKLMHDHAQGGQIVYPIVDDNWVLSPEKQRLIDSVLSKKPDDAFIDISIKLGGILIFAANTAGLSYLQKSLPKQSPYPLKLAHHGAFHSSHVGNVVPMAQQALSVDMLSTPNLPLIDGKGRIWQPQATDLDALYDYTFGTQINSLFDYSKAVEVGIKEFAPDMIIILGPGSTLGGPTAQELIKHRWQGLKNKADFKHRQSQDPYIISMNIDEQRRRVI